MNELDAMYRVADDHECSVLDRLRVKAGLTWEHYGCWTNTSDDPSCGRCGVPYEQIPDEDKAGFPVGVKP